MTDPHPPGLLPQAGTQAKTGLASLPPRPAHITTLPSRSGADTYRVPPKVEASDPRMARPAAPHKVMNLSSTGAGREGREGGTNGNLPETPSSAVRSSSSSSRASIDRVFAHSTSQTAASSSTILGKRPFEAKAQTHDEPAVTNDTASTALPTGIHSEPRIIPILPTPLPSKRFKKGAQSRASLVPVEQLPVFPLPPLPVISDPSLEKQVFTHQSCFPRRKWRFEDPEEDPSLDYEKLEHVGDSILGMVVTTWLHELKPRLTCGRASVSYDIPHSRITKLIYRN